MIVIVAPVLQASSLDVLFVVIDTSDPYYSSISFYPVFLMRYDDDFIHKHFLNSIDEFFTSCTTI